MTGPVRAVRFGVGRVTASAGGRLGTEAERATDAVLAGRFPEALARSLIEQRVVERVVSQLVDSGDVDRLVESALADERTVRLVHTVAASPAVERMLIEAVESRLAAVLTERLIRRPEVQEAIEDAVRAALARRAATLVDRVTAGVRHLDVGLEGPPRRWTRRPPRTPDAAQEDAPVGYAGLGSRGAAALVDFIAVHLMFLLSVAMAALVFALASWRPSQAVADGLAAGGWLAVVLVYFVGFWAIAGQTPGMALLRVRLVDGSGGRLGWGRACLRFIATLVAIAFLLLGYLPVLIDDRRRGLPDMLARTLVIYEPSLAEGEARSIAAASSVPA